MIFSAGLGTRLYPLTKDRPKALAPFGNGTLLSYNIDFLKKQGINSFIINTHHFAGKIEKYLEDNDFFRSDIVISYEEMLLDTAGGLANIYKYLQDTKHILVYNVDVISEIDVKKMLLFHEKNKNDITLAVRKRQSARYLLFDENGTLAGWKNIKSGETIIKKTAFSYHEYGYSGIGIFNKEMVKLIGAPEKKSLIPFFLDNCADKTIAMYDHTPEYWFDCGSVEKLQEAGNFFKKQT